MVFPLAGIYVIICRCWPGLEENVHSAARTPQDKGRNFDTERNL
ncbi:hypothetical protein CLOM621_07973 [Clostridium sp. M62/1]|nr:hypothetical protein CLOM621_07973 [Clostridium sp. M62/1]